MAVKPEDKDEAGTLVYATTGPPWTLDPAVSWDDRGWMVISNVYDTLIEFRENQFFPMIATEIPTLENGGISADRLTYRFQIRNNAKFHDGTRLTAEDVEYSIERVMVYGEGASWLFYMVLGYNDEAIVNAVEVDGDDVIVHLLYPFAPFMQILATPLASIVSKQFCIDRGDWPGTAETIQEYRELGPKVLHEATIGTGPFTMESWTEQEMVLVRNNHYFKKPARSKRVIIKYLPDWEERKLMFLSGEVDIITNVPPYARAELEAAEGVRVYTDLPRLVMFKAGLNHEISPTSPFIGSGALDGNGIPTGFFDDLNVRKAFAHAFDYESVIDTIWGGEATQPASVVIEGLPFHNPDQEKYGFDLEQAENYFKQAMGGQVWEHGFTFTIPVVGGAWATIFEFLKTQVESINPKFHIEVAVVTYYEYLMFLFSGEAPLTHLGWGADYPDPDNFVMPFMESEQSYSLGYSDPYVDDLIQQGRFEVEDSAREAIYFELQQIYHDDVVGIPIAQPLTRHYERDWVRGWYYSPYAPIDFYTIWIDDDDNNDDQ
jgi:peptide/nickel transport system substrate-binding protein